MVAEDTRHHLSRLIIPHRHAEAEALHNQRLTALNGCWELWVSRFMKSGRALIRNICHVLL